MAERGRGSRGSEGCENRIVKGNEGRESRISGGMRGVKLRQLREF